MPWNLLPFSLALCTAFPWFELDKDGGMSEEMGGSTDDTGWSTVNILMNNTWGRVMKQGRDILVKKGYNVVDAMARQHMTNNITEATSKDIGNIVDEMRHLDAAEAVKVAKNEIRSTPDTLTAQSYADTARRAATPIKAVTIIIQKVEGINLKDYNLTKLNERELTEKANLALDGIQLIEECSNSLKFMGAQKMKGEDILLILNSAEARRWLSQEDVMKGFLAGFNGTSKMRTSMLIMVAKYILINFNLNKKGSLLRIEQEGGLDKGSIWSVDWIRPPECWSPLQQYAHMKLRFKDKSQADKAI
ncbi:hypothetical protein BDN71DRAFT_1576979 [Pleurotus eryngii]|uniref:Uncharacterized protein n=1 Tax=Pleurotus eryngii TaxID=5323 RepID=A0A9P6A4X2_PLEER|nr:hypothetical protein BDN71DRAFT_1576979 [Pleurotus eryngii]